MKPRLPHAFCAGSKTSTCPMWWFSAVKPDGFDGSDEDLGKEHPHCRLFQSFFIAGKLWIAKDLCKDGVEEKTTYLKVSCSAFF